MSINVDPKEIHKFEELASRWWDRNSEFKPLHDINPLRANWIDQRAEVAEKDLLDVGCGGGILCEAMAQRGAKSHPAAFDTVTCLEMLEHVPDPSSVVKACAAMTKPGGMIFFSTINRNPKSYLLAIIGVEYVLRMLPKGTHEFSKFIRPSELSQWAREAGLEITEMTGLLYNPLTKTYKLSQTDVDVNYMICARKPA